jgi:hypothetical protein
VRNSGYRGLWISMGVIAVLTALVVGWLGYMYHWETGGPLLLRPQTPLIERGIAMIMVCGEDKSFAALTEKVPSAYSWDLVSPEKRGECTVFYQHSSFSD